MSLPTSPNIKSPWLLMAVAVIILLVGIGIGRISQENTKPESQTKPAQSADKPMTPVMSVEAITPTKATISQSIHANGTIAGKEIATVGSRISGVAIERVLVDVGDWVNQGQTLAVLDSQSLNQDANALNAELRQAKANLDRATADLARIEPLLAIDAISRQQYDSYQTAKVQAVASVDALNARLASLNINQARTQVVAPVSGVIAERLADVGMMATGGKLFTIIKDGTLEWQASVKADNAHDIRLGQAVEIDAGDGVAVAEVTRISPTVNASRELTVYARLLDTQGLKSGMFQSGRILFGEQNALLLPQRAIMNQDGYDFVWQLKATAKPDIYQVQKHKVLLGDYQADGVVVDLPQDISVVAQGGNFLNDGDFVKVVEHAKAPSDTPQDSQTKAGEGL